jgi:putative spermidine/putrescine transport system ATP-binding protein
MALGDRVVVMSHGRIAQIGSPADIYLRPADRFVAEFVGVMNRVVGERRGSWLYCPGGRIALPDAADDGPGEAMFRPEHVRLAESPQASLHGRVSASFFLGDRTRVLVEGIGERPVIVDLVGPVPVLIGDPVSLEITALTMASSG